jgi:hypothetical protein
MFFYIMDRLAIAPKQDVYSLTRVNCVDSITTTDTIEMGHHMYNFLEAAAAYNKTTFEYTASRPLIH